MQRGCKISKGFIGQVINGTKAIVITSKLQRNVQTLTKKCGWMGLKDALASNKMQATHIYRDSLTAAVITTVLTFVWSAKMTKNVTVVLKKWFHWLRFSCE